MLSTSTSHHCTKCHRGASSIHKYCGTCGGTVVRKELPSDLVKCVKCHKDCRRDNQHCTNCGQSPQWLQWEQNLSDDYDEMWRQDHIKHTGIDPKTGRAVPRDGQTY